MGVGCVADCEEALVLQDIVRVAAAIKGCSLSPLIVPEPLEELAEVTIIISVSGVYAAGPVAALDALEAWRPEPTLFPNGNRGMPLALVPWAVQSAIGGGHRAAQALIDRQLADGRTFLQGGSPGLADAASFAALGGGQIKVSGAPLVAAWFNRMRALVISAVPKDPDTVKPERMDGAEHTLHLRGGSFFKAVRTRDAGSVLYVHTPAGAHGFGLPLYCDKSLVRDH